MVINLNKNILLLIVSVLTIIAVVFSLAGFADQAEAVKAQRDVLLVSVLNLLILVFNIQRGKMAFKVISGVLFLINLLLIVYGIFTI